MTETTTTDTTEYFTLDDAFLIVACHVGDYTQAVHGFKAFLQTNEDGTDHPFYQATSPAGVKRWSTLTNLTELERVWHAINAIEVHDGASHEDVFDLVWVDADFLDAVLAFGGFRPIFPKPQFGEFRRVIKAMDHLRQQAIRAQRTAGNQVVLARLEEVFPSDLARTQKSLEVARAKISQLEEEQLELSSKLEQAENQSLSPTLDKIPAAQMTNYQDAFIALLARAATDTPFDPHKIGDSADDLIDFVSDNFPGDDIPIPDRKTVVKYISSGLKRLREKNASNTEFIDWLIG